MTNTATNERPSKPKAARKSLQPAMEEVLDRLETKDNPVGKFLSSRQICQDLGDICLRSLSRLRIADRTFPKPVVISNRNYWVYDLYDAWKRDQIRRSLRTDQ